MSVVLGFAAKLYRNNGSYAVPDWVEMDNVKECKLTLSGVEIDVTTRGGGGYQQTEPGLIDANLEFGINWDTSDENFTALQAAFLARTSLDVLALDGAYTVAGSQGLRMTAKVTKFDRDEPVAGILATSVTMRPCIADNSPEWYTATT